MTEATPRGTFDPGGIRLRIAARQMFAATALVAHRQAPEEFTQGAAKLLGDTRRQDAEGAQEPGQRGTAVAGSRGRGVAGSGMERRVVHVVDVATP